VRTLCVGEALVDLICPVPAAGPAAAPSFVPHPGGSVLNVALGCARAGGQAVFAGAVGDDAWGRFLTDRMDAEGLERLVARVPEVQTPVAFVTVDEDAVPAYAFYGAGLVPGLPRLAEQLPLALRSCGALFLTSNTLVGEAERDLSFALRDQAAAEGKPLVVDANLRPSLWPTASRAVEETLDLVRGAFLCKCNDEEAQLLTGERDLDRAADGLLAAGAQHVVITRGPAGAALRGGPRDLDVPGVPVDPVDTTGAGDALTGVLLARLGLAGFYPPAIAAALPEAVAVAARTTTHHGALPPA
jgi:sugar/nucleoside kinase (ribokinase family)